MNEKRRRRLSDVVDALGAVIETVSIVSQEEAEAFGNLPCGIADGEQGERMEFVIDALDTASELIAEAQQVIMETVS